MTNMSIYNRGGRGIAADMAAGLGGAKHPRISIKGNRFSLIDAGGTKFPWPYLVLPVIIVDANKHVSKMFFADAYDPNDDTPPAPTCWSDNGVGPSINARHKVWENCTLCPLNAWGSMRSAVTGDDTKACADRRKLAVIVLGDPTELVYELNVPPASLGGKHSQPGHKNMAAYSEYVRQFNTPDGSRKADVCDLVTLISFAGDKNGIIQFKEGGWLHMVEPNGAINPQGAADGGLSIMNRIETIWDNDVTAKLIGSDDQPWTGARQGIPEGFQIGQLRGAAPQLGAQSQVPATAGPGVQGAPPPNPAAPGLMVPPPNPAGMAGADQAASAATTNGTGGRRRGRPTKTAQLQAPPATAVPTGTPAMASPAQPAFGLGAPPAVPASPPQGEQTVIPPGADPGELPAFLQRQASPVGQAKPMSEGGPGPAGFTPAPPPGQPAFGMAQPQRIEDPNLANALQQAFSLAAGKQ